MGGLAIAQGMVQNADRIAGEQRQHKQAMADEAHHQKIKDLIDQRDKLAENAKALQGTPDFDKAHDALKQVNLSLIDAYDPRKHPGMIQAVGHLLTDALKITSHEKRQAKQDEITAQRGQKADTQTQQELEAAPLSPIQKANADAASKLASIQAAQKNFDTVNPTATPEDKQTFLNDLIQKTYGTTIAGNWERATGKVDGEPVVFDFDKKTQRYRYPSGESVPPDILAAFRPDQKGRPLVKKGFKIDPATGQAVDQDTGTRYNRGAQGNPPEVEAMFQGSDKIEAKKQAFQLKLASIRGAQYNMTKPMTTLDTQNGNAPTVVTFADMRKNPTRYMPAGEADKALAKENLMQDIAGTSNLTRQAIVNLKEDFPEEMKAKIALAMRADDPHSAMDQLISSGALGSLSDDQQDFLIATRQLAENAMAMRSILGAGQGSEDMRNAIRDTLPGLLSPDRSFAIRQLDAFDKTIQRLHRGVPKVQLRTDLDDNGKSSTNTPQSKGKVSIQKAKLKPQYKNMSDDQIKKEIESHGYQAVP